MKTSGKSFGLCIDNSDHEASLIVGKVYPLIRDDRALKDELVRLVDESGEDYLYHHSHFIFVDFPKAVQKKIRSLQPVSS